MRNKNVDKSWKIGNKKRKYKQENKKDVRISEKKSSLKIRKIIKKYQFLEMIISLIIGTLGIAPVSVLIRIMSA